MVFVKQNYKILCWMCSLTENELPEYSNVKFFKNIHKINQPWV